MVHVSSISHRIKPINNRFISKLKAPILAGALAIGGYLSANANKLPEKDTFEPKVVIVNDTIKENTLPADTLILADMNVNDSISPEIKSAKKNPLALDTPESAAEGLYTEVLANIANCGDNPYSSLYLALSDQKNNSNGLVYSPATVDNLMDNVLESIKIYTRDHKDEIQQEMEKNGSLTEFHYGENNSKTGILFQTLDISGINQNNEKDNNTAQNDTVTQNNKKFIGNVSYRMKAVTDKAEVETNIHAGSDNMDLQFAAAYRTKTEDGGNLLLSLNGRETMNNNITDGSLGASVDYNKNKFSTGLYYYHNIEGDEDGSKYTSSTTEGYLKYKQNVKLKAGLETYDYEKYYYTGLKLSGIKDLSRSSTKLSGDLSAEIGSYQMDLSSVGVDKLIKYTNLDIGANAGIYFKTDDMSASLNGKVSYVYMANASENNYNSQELHLSVLGAFSTGKISVSAMCTAFKTFLSGDYSSLGENINLDNIDVSTGVAFEIKDLLKGISPMFSYTSTSINNKVQHFFNVTLKTSLETLRKKQ